MGYGLSMYVPGQGHEHLGPGTSLVQRINWTTGQEMQTRGLGCSACGGGCDTGCQARGLGLFDSGMDVSGWSWPEWSLVFIGGYALVSMFQTTQRGVRAAREFPGRARGAVKRGRKKLAARIAGE